MNKLLLKQKIAQNTSISFIGKILSSVLGMISIAFIARKLGPDGFGSYNTVIAFLYVFSVFADFGLYNILTRDISKPKADEKEVIINIFFLRAVLLLIFFSFSLVITYFLPFYSQQIKLGIFIATFGFIFLSLSQVLMGIFQKYLKTLYPAIADITTRTIQLILVLWLYVKDAGFISFLLVFVFGSLINFLLVYYFSQKIIKLDFSKIKITKNKLKKLLFESWPLAVSSVLVLIYFKGDTLLLSFLKSPTDVGIYNVPYKILENIIFFPAMFVGLIMPLLSKNYINNKNQFKKIFQKSFDILNAASIPIVFGGFYLADKIVFLIGGDQYTQSIIVFKVLIFSMFFIFLGALFGNAIIAINKQKKIIPVYAIAAIFNIGANLFFIEKYSYIGASIVSVLTEILATTLMFLLIHKFIKFTPHLKLFSKSILSSVLMVFFIWLTPFENIIILISVGIITYLIFMYIFKGISKEDFLLFFKKENA